MKRKNIFLMILGLIMFTASSQAAKQTMQIKDLGMDGENRLYDLLCPSGQGTTLFHHVGPGALENTEELPIDDETINIEKLAGEGGDITFSSKPTVCTSVGEGELECSEYKDIDTAAEAVCKKLG